jgi:hypothetical protein
MVQFKAIIKKFQDQGEKTSWSYISIPPEISEQIKPGVRKSYRVKGFLDDYAIKQTAVLPMGNGAFILPLKAEIRKAIRKSEGSRVKIILEEDNKPLKISDELMSCLEDSPGAKQKFTSMPSSHQMYYSKWIESGKTVQTRAKRIHNTIIGMERNLSFAEVLKLNAQSVNK